MGEIILDYLGGPNVTTVKEKDMRGVMEDVTVEAEVGVITLLVGRGP